MQCAGGHATSAIPPRCASLPTYCLLLRVLAEHEMVGAVREARAAPGHGHEPEARGERLPNGHHVASGVHLNLDHRLAVALEDVDQRHGMTAHLRAGSAVV